MEMFSFRQPSPGVLSVRDYGATGDGSTDDTAAIAAAIAAAASGQTVIFPAGSYKTTGNSIRLKDGVNLHFAQGVTVTYAGVSNVGVINDGAGAVTCKITGGGTFAGGATTCGLLLTAASTLLLECNDLTGTNGAFYTNSACVLDLRAQTISGYITIEGAATATLRANLFTSSIGVNSASARVYGYGYMVAGGPVLTVTAGTCDWWGDINGTNSDAVNTKGGTLTVHGNLTSANDCAAYCSSGTLIVHGKCVSNGANVNLAGRGNGFAAATGTLRIYGDVSGPIAGVCGEADVLVTGRCTTTGAASAYSEQTPQLDTAFDHAEYRPAAGAAADSYLQNGVVKVRSTGKVTVLGGITTVGNGPALRVDAGDAEVVGCELKCTNAGASGWPVRMGGGTLTLRSATLTAGAGVSESINATAAATVIVNGAASASVGSDKPANVTLRLRGQWTVADRPVAPYVLAYRSSDVAIATATTTTVVFNTETTDNWGAYDNSTGEFTAPIAGEYEVDFGVFWYSGTNNVNSDIYVNGSSVIKVHQQIQLGAIQLNGCKKLRLAAGDVVTIRIAQDQGSNRSILGAAIYTRLAIRLLQ